MQRARVAATSANLGPGFDSLGLALDLDLEVRVHPDERDRLEYRGEGHVDDHPDNLIHQGFRAVYAELGAPVPTVRFEVDNPIPLARGLGSSSAALVAGAALADAMLGTPLGRDGIFQLTAGLEGHPDNVAPAVHGGFTVSALGGGGRFATASLPLPTDWKLLFGVPTFELPTSAARAALPERYSRSDTVLTASRAALWVAAVAQRRPELLTTASRDVLHEPYREALVSGLAAARSDLLAAGAYASFLSGAGPTLAAICEASLESTCRELLQRFAGDGRVLALGPGRGYRCEPS
jgi:homoserine kinase